MTYKWIGAVLIVLSCGGFGLYQAAAYRREERSLGALLTAIDYMACDLQYRLTPLPDLCRQTSREGSGCVHDVFSALARELDMQIAPDVTSCMNAALASVSFVPEKTEKLLRQLGQSMGRFDLQGQLRGLAQIREACCREAEALAVHRDEKVRSLQTLGLCAGAALAVLLI